MAPTSPLPRTPRVRPWGFAVALVLPVVACAAGGNTGSPFTGGTASNSGGSNGGNGGNGSTGGGNNSSGGGFGSGSGSSGNSDHMEVCNEAGMCSCVSIASLGWEGVWGPCASDTTTAFQNWLNTQSTAHVDTFNTHASIPSGTITSEWLAQYNVLILQWMVDSLNVTRDNTGATTGVTEGTPWQLSSAEQQAIADWVKAGGGIISMSGYNCQGGSAYNCQVVDNVATNAVLSSFTDLSYNSDNTLNADPNGGTPPCDSENCYCWGASLPLGTMTSAIATPLTTTTASSMGLAVGSWNQSTPIGANITDIGAYNGRSIKVGGSNYGTVVVDSQDSQFTYAAHEQIGKGYVFAYTDEWVTYTGEWTGEISCTQGLNFDSGSCAGKSAQEVFQIPQFWYNSIKYVAGGVKCFMIQGVQ